MTAALEQTEGRVLTHLIRLLVPRPLQEPAHGCLGRCGQALQEGTVALHAVDRGCCPGSCSLLCREVRWAQLRNCGTLGPADFHSPGTPTGMTETEVTINPQASHSV